MNEMPWYLKPFEEAIKNMDNSAKMLPQDGKEMTETYNTSGVPVDYQDRMAQRMVGYDYQSAHDSGYLEGLAAGIRMRSESVFETNWTTGCELFVRINDKTYISMEYVLKVIDENIAEKTDKIAGYNERGEYKKMDALNCRLVGMHEVRRAIAALKGEQE